MQRLPTVAIVALVLLNLVLGAAVAAIDDPIPSEPSTPARPVDPAVRAQERRLEELRKQLFQVEGRVATLEASAPAVATAAPRNSSPATSWADVADRVASVFLLLGVAAVLWVMKP